MRHEKEQWKAMFTPSKTKVVRFVDSEGKVVKIEHMNRQERRRRGIKNASA
jgi:hypothetical protein